jgi:hypothetical protein
MSAGLRFDKGEKANAKTDNLGYCCDEIVRHEAGSNRPRVHPVVAANAARPKFSIR